MLDPAVLLNIIEQSDAPTIASLYGVPMFRELIIQHRVSLLSTIHNSYLLPTTSGGRQFVLDHSDLATQANKKAEAFMRRPVSLQSWNSIHVIHARNDHIDRLFQGTFLGSYVDCRPWPRFRGDAQLAKWRLVLKRALLHCDAIADMEADSIKSPRRLNPDIQLPLEVISIENAIAFISSFLPFDVNIQARMRPPWVAGRNHCRALQRGYIAELPLIDLCALVALLRIARMSYWDQRSRVKEPTTDIAVWAEDLASFKEALIRNGNWFLGPFSAQYSCFPDTHAPRVKHAHNLVQLARRDMRAFEGGRPHTSDGVHMTLMRLLAEKLGVEDPERVTTEALLRVDEVVRGWQMVRPVTFAFAM